MEHANGLYVRVGLEPNTDYLEHTSPPDGNGQIIVNGRTETKRYRRFRPRCSSK